MRPGLSIWVDGQWQKAGTLEGRGTTIVGRSTNSDICIEDPNCSREHFAIDRQDDTFTLRDLNSRNGTKLGEQPVRSTIRLRDGDVIRAGDSRILFQTSVGVDSAPEVIDFNLPGGEETATEPRKGSVSVWIDQLKNKDSSGRTLAQHDLVERYFVRLCHMARRRGRGLARRAEDEEDAAIKALGSFFRRVEEFPQLNNREELWRVLATITARKVHRQREHQMAGRRGGGQKLRTFDSSAVSAGESSEPVANVPDRTMNQQLAVELKDAWKFMLEKLDCDETRKVAVSRLHGLSNREIAEALGCSNRTIERRLRRIRKIWLEVSEGA